jgi:hypothetical protein
VQDDFAGLRMLQLPLGTAAQRFNQRVIHKQFAPRTDVGNFGQGARREECV